MIGQIAYISFALSLVLGISEIIKLEKGIKDKKTIGNSKKHNLQHIALIGIFLLLNIFIAFSIYFYPNMCMYEYTFLGLNIYFNIFILPHLIEERTGSLN